MFKRNEKALQEASSAVHESFKAMDPKYAAPHYEAGIRHLFSIAGLVMFVEICMRFLAAPRFRAKFMRRAPTHEELLDLLDRYLAVVEADSTADSEFRRTIEPTRQMRALLETWEFGVEVPEPIAKVARSWLKAKQTPEPPEGWDQWSGPAEWETEP